MPLLSRLAVSAARGYGELSSKAIPPNYRATFNGTSQYLSVATNSVLNFGTGDFTVECWFNRTGTNEGSPGYVQTPLVIGNDNTGLVVGIYLSVLYCYFVGTGAVWRSVSPAISNNTWYYFTWVRSGSTMTCYINGSSIGTVTDSSSHTSSTGGLVIANNNGTGTPFNKWQGYVSNVRVSNTALYSGNFTAPTSPSSAVSGTQFLTIVSPSIVDSSSNNLSITNTGSVAYTTFSF